MKRYAIAALLAATLALPAAAQEHLNVYAGGWDVFKDSEDGPSNNMEGMLGAEYRGNYLWAKLRPNVGVLVTMEGSQYYYGGFGYDVFFTDSHSVVFTPNLAVGAYREGDGKSLGGTLEFKSGLELAYQWPDQQRLGLAIHHISNAHIYDKNPGTELATIQYSYPLNIFGK